jgi:hypothetical protein
MLHLDVSSARCNARSIDETCLEQLLKFSVLKLQMSSGEIAFFDLGA